MRASARAASHRPTSTWAASATSSPRSSATTSSAAERAAPRNSAAPTSEPRSRSSSSPRHAGRRSRCRSRWRSTCKVCGGDGVEPGTQPLTVSALRRERSPAAGVAQRLRRVRPHPDVPGLPRARARSSSTRARSAAAPGASRSRATLDVDVPAGIHDGQRIRVSGEGHAGALGGRAGDVYVLVRVKPDPRFVREGNDIYSQVDLTIVQAALGATVAGRDARRAGRARASGRHAAGRGASPARQGHARPAGLRPRRPARARQRLGAAPASPTSSAACSRSSRRRATSTPTGTTRASSTS